MELLSFTHVSEWLKPISLGAEGIQDDLRSGQRSTVQNLRTVAKFFFLGGGRGGGTDNQIALKFTGLRLGLFIKTGEEKDLRAMYATQSHRAVTTCQAFIMTR
jgi:hypothetical protein